MASSNQRSRPTPRIDGFFTKSLGRWLPDNQTQTRTLTRLPHSLSCVVALRDGREHDLAVLKRAAALRDGREHDFIVGVGDTRTDRHRLFFQFLKQDDGIK